MQGHRQERSSAGLGHEKARPPHRTRYRSSSACLRAAVALTRRERRIHHARQNQLRLDLPRPIAMLTREARMKATKRAAVTSQASRRLMLDGLAELALDVRAQTRLLQPPDL